MAIEFECPACESTIRVPDAVAGRKGKCPRCKQIVLVPQVEIPPAAAASAPIEPAPQPRPVPEQPAATSADPTRPDWMKGKAAKTEEPAGFVEAPVDGPPDFAALAGDVAAAPEPLVRTGVGPKRQVAEPPSTPTAPVNELGLPVVETRRRRAEPAESEAASDGKSKDSNKRGGRRGRRKTAAPTKPWLFPVLGVVALACVFVGYQLTTSPPLWLRDMLGTPAPEIEAEAFTYLRLEPKSLDSATAKVKLSTFTEVSDRLAAQQVAINSALMNVEFRGSKGAIDVRVAVGSETMFVKIEKSRTPDLVEALKKRRSELDEPQRLELQAAARDFCRIVADDGIAFDANQLGRFRNELGLNSLNGVLGSHLEAVHREKVYLCVYEDVDALYFLLPRNAKSFLLRGREFEGDGVVLPVKYEVKIAEVHDVDPPDGDDDPWRRSGTDEDTEADAPGLGEALDQPDTNTPDGEMMKKPDDT